MAVFGTAFDLCLPGERSRMSNFVHKALFQNGLIPAYSKLADLAALRHKLVASNIANVNTQGYEKRTMQFDNELRKALDKPRLAGTVTDEMHIPLGDNLNRAPEIDKVKKSDNDTGINSVDIDQELADLAQNQITFEFGADMLARKFKALKSAIKGES